MASTPNSTGSSPELTARVIVLGIVLSVVMGAANVYVGLKAGMTVSASIPAAVMAMLCFRLLGRSTIREANQVQTCASAGESLAAGIIFTMPALLLIGYWQDFDFWTVSIVALTGGLLGILFMIPMRRVFVVNNKELPYPEGIACASVLKAGEGGQTGAAKSLVIGGLLGATYKIVAGALGLIHETVAFGTSIGNRIFYFGSDLSPMLVAVGFIVRLNVAALIFIGGIIGWVVGIPIFGSANEVATEIAAGDATKSAGEISATAIASQIWSTQIRYIGVGAMVVAGLSSLITVRHGLVEAIKQIRNRVGGNDTPENDRDIPTWSIGLLLVVCTGLLFYMNYMFTKSVPMSVLCTVVMLALGFFFTAVASYIVGLVGNSNSPVSGMTISAVLIAGGLLYISQFSGQEAMVATLGVAAIVCCVACTSGDVCNDLKTGSLVGATPYRQQIMQVIGVAVAAFVMAPVLQLLHDNTEGGIGGPNLAAPQAQLFRNLADGFFGTAELPKTMIAIGAVIGVVILVIDSFLKRSNSPFRLYLMPTAIGIYLPFGLSVPIFIGGLIAYIYGKGFQGEAQERRLYRGVLFSSGIVAGEALTAVGIAACIAAYAAFSQMSGEQAEAAATEPMFGEPMILTFSLISAALIISAFFIMARPTHDEPAETTDEQV